MPLWSLLKVGLLHSRQLGRRKGKKMQELPGVSPLMDKMTEDLKQLLVSRAVQNPVMVGIHTGGAWVAEQLHEGLGLAEPLGTLDIAFYRDDYDQRGLQPQVRPSSLPFSIDGRHVILVDDVIMSGRTIRAAFNELFDYGRPASITLVTLLSVNGRELPIQPDVCGHELIIQAGERVKLAGPQPLALKRVKVDS